ncbi:MAG: hypothetical protein JWN69_985 [Alphaproteobacteria bacterium]|nr:hypothetical protein [Alphaproteobacteria bacterium]
MTSRPLTQGERALARSIFGDAIDYAPVRIKRRRWFPLQPRHIVMAPTGHIHVHPASEQWSEDYSNEPLRMQALFLHELTHVWQSQMCGKYYLPLMRHPFCRYSYRLKPGRRFKDYGLEQQAEIVRHLFLLRNGASVIGAPPLAMLEALVPFGAHQPANS